MTTKPTNKGEAAEQLACAYLQQQGLRLLEKNYRCRQGEIDLVMQQGDSLVFIEVRQRSHARFGGAAASVTTKKQEKLRLTALHYLQHKAPGANARFDVVAVQGEQTQQHIEWIRNAF
ncbi:MAG TPA: YraN family protein [Gammaproteobacteria bacterium]|nr:YraN family protein [Gammaproteobacteria bacterium]